MVTITYETADGTVTEEDVKVRYDESAEEYIIYDRDGKDVEKVVPRERVLSKEKEEMKGGGTYIEM